MSKLTVFKIKNAKPKEKPYKLWDEKGLYLYLTTAGGKSWRVKYYFNGKEKVLSLGTYPETSLQEARERRDTARKQVQAGTDPSELRRQAKQEMKETVTFKQVALEWYAKKKSRWHDNGLQILNALNNHVFPVLGSIPVEQVTKKDVLAFIRRMEDANKIETAKRLRQKVKEIFQYAIGTDRMEHITPV